MPKVKKVTGTSHEVIKVTFNNHYVPPPSRGPNGRLRDPVTEVTKTSPYSINVGNIITDLNRVGFFPSHGKTIDDFVRDWINTSSADFAQGNPTAATYQFLLSLLMANPLVFWKDGEEGARAKEYEAYLKSMRRIDFGYYNDEGILCAVSITYSTKDPSLWIASSTRNTVGKDPDRPTFYLSSEEFVSADKGESVESDVAAPEFLAFLKSATVRKMFEGVFLADGLIDLEKLEGLQAVEIDLEVFKELLRTAEVDFETVEESLTVNTHLERLEESPTVNVDLEKLETLLTDKIAPEKLQGLFEGLSKAVNVEREKFEGLRKTAKRVAPVAAGHRKTFLDRKALFEQLIKERDATKSNNTTLEQASQQSFVRRNAGSLFLGFLALMTLVNLVLIVTGVFSPLGFILEGVKNYLAFGSAAVVGVASAANLASNEHQLSIYQESIGEKIFETRARAAFLALDKKEAEDALREKQEAEKALLEQPVLVPGMGEAVNHIPEDDSEGFGVVGEVLDEVVYKDSQLLEVTALVKGLSEKSSVPSPKKKEGVVMPTDGIITDQGVPTYS